VGPVEIDQHLFQALNHKRGLSHLLHPRQVVLQIEEVLQK
jgi:hypothetical protein